MSKHGQRVLRIAFLCGAHAEQKNLLRCIRTPPQGMRSKARSAYPHCVEHVGGMSHPLWCGRGVRPSNAAQPEIPIKTRRSVNG
jgi:hypothetical protein